MTSYYPAAEGDPLSSSSQSWVMPSGANAWFTEQGHRSMVLIGGDAYCAKCKSVGKIIGGSGCSEIARLHDSSLGQRHAVAGDFVQCQCSTKPTIVACYGKSWTIEDNYSSYLRTQSSSSSSSSANTDSSSDELVVLQDEEGNPVAGLRCRITTDPGDIHEGVSNARGETTRVYSNKPTYMNIELVV